MSSGTLEDKISAMTLLVQESPLHTRKAFEQLAGLSHKKSRNQAIMALTALKDLLGQGNVLPADRKLRPFGKQPALLSAFQGNAAQWKQGQDLPGDVEKVHLIYWAYEDWLKKAYFDMLKVLESWCNDEIEYTQNRALTFVSELLKEKPEQEENLLRLIVNKLGDTNKKIASKASHLLLQLQVTHPAMKEIVINAIESDLLFRPGQSAHAKYYAIITLNQTILSVREEHVANKLLDIYFSLFVSLLKVIKPERKMEPKLHKSGANSIKLNGKEQGGGGKPGRKAEQKAKSKENAYKAEEELSEKMIAQVLTGVNRAFPFAKTDDAHFESQLNMIFRVTHSSNFNTAIQALMLIQQISAVKHFATDRFYRTLYESLLDPRLLTSSKQILYLNLLYRSLKNDVSIKRVKAFVKRLLQIITLHEPPFVCGVLYLISELQITFPSIKGMLDTPEANEEDEEEHFVDAPEDSTAPAIDNNTNEQTTATPKNAYDPKKRDPEHSNAHVSCLWDLIPLTSHFHPSVSLFATRLLASAPAPPKPDPTLHTLMHFLDRFAYRNARTKAAAMRGSSIMQPLAGADTGDRLIKAGDMGRGELPVNNEEYWKRQGGKGVAADEVFFQKYFEKKPRKGRKEKVEAGGVDGDEEGSEKGEDEIWKALVGSRPEVEGGGDFEEDDIDLEGMDDDDDEEEEEGHAVGMDDGVEINLESDQEDEDELVDADDTDAGLEADFDFEDGEDAMLGSDEDVPVDVEEAFEGFSGDEGAKKQKKTTRAEERKQKRKLKHLPTFASAEDYAKLLGQDDDDEDGGY